MDTYECLLIVSGSSLPEAARMGTLCNSSFIGDVIPYMEYNAKKYVRYP
jgi:hypothetical protein